MFCLEDFVKEGWKKGPEICNFETLSSGSSVVCVQTNIWETLDEITSRIFLGFKMEDFISRCFNDVI